MSRDFDPNFVHVPVYFEVGVKMVVRSGDNKILVLKRSEVCGSKYSLPGGGLDMGEDIFEACNRECLEELNVSCTPKEILNILCDNPDSKESKRGIVAVVLCELNSNDIELNWEHDSYDWFDINSALSLELTNHARRILTSLDK